MIEAALAEGSPAEISAGFLHAARAAGASYLQTRVYRRPGVPLTSATHWAAGGLVSRIAPPDWAGSAAFNYICFEKNPLLAAIRESRTRYRFGDFAPQEDRAFGEYWEAMSEAGMAEALCATSYGAGGKIASLHLGVTHRDFVKGEAEAIQRAGLVLTERLIDLAEPPAREDVTLSVREHDALRYVADGKTDWEIGVILGVSQSTARFHIDNARRKLGAVNRAQAVARMAVRRLI
ncbi:helix-turn-helix transcriptional regulator [Sphingomonas sp. LB-2]|uniref:helix-turn-helix transcriptional regulator n=1 Tax=Sphingomonas caeni TaxID=2984949 RepID=UPI002230602D|nr:helix-turn-helix transcriptional regulator [Sphingomonas caeni]MCW3848726.1 helix-turn-helix transcriptional regulator [Sphingomonas caeni]